MDIVNNSWVVVVVVVKLTDENWFDVVLMIVNHEYLFEKIVAELVDVEI